MTWEPPSDPDPDAVDAQAGYGADHRKLLHAVNLALADSSARALLGCVQTIHRIVLAADPGALRRSVGWFGRLLARDITLQAESEALRSELGVHVIQARQQLHALLDSDRQLQALSLSLQAAIDDLGQQSTRLADRVVTGNSDDCARRLSFLVTLATSLKTTASHLDLTVLNHRELSQRVQQMLPQVELLVDQQRMLRAGLTDQAALHSAKDAMDALKGLQLLPQPDVAPESPLSDDTTSDDTMPR